MVSNQLEVMIDIETLGIPGGLKGGPHFPALWQVGLVIFHIDPNNNFNIMHSCHFTLDYLEQRNLVRANEVHWDSNTVRFHMTHSPKDFLKWEDYKNINSDPVVSNTVAELSDELCNLIPSNARIWCKGTDFDIPILKHFLQMHRPVPWKYNNVRDLRTLIDIAKDIAGLEEFNEKATHNAYEDAMLQTSHLKRAIKALKDAVKFDL